MSMKTLTFPVACLAAILALAMMPARVAAHPSAAKHMSDYRSVFSDIQGYDFRSLCETISGDIDTALVKSFEAEIGPVPGGPVNHRILGHSWALGEDIPRDKLRLLENAFPGRKADIVHWWRRFSDSEIAKISKMTALPKHQARTLGNIVWRIHLFGDRMPDNTRVDHVLPTRENAERLIRDIRVLAGGKSPALCRNAEQSIRKAMLMKTESERAEAFFREFGKNHELSQLMERSIGTRGSASGIHPAGAVSGRSTTMGSNGRTPAAAGRLMAQGRMVSANTSEGAKAWEGARTRVKGNAGQVKIRPGLLTADGRLLVSVESGAAAGVLVFAADAGTACYRYWQGDILDAEFAEGVADAAIKGLAVGTAVAVAVMLGATPTGWCILAVSTVTYIIVDMGLRIWHEIDERRFLRESDLAAFGITMDTVLKPHDAFPEMRDAILDTTLCPL